MRAIKKEFEGINFQSVEVMISNERSAYNIIDKDIIEFWPWEVMLLILEWYKDWLRIDLSIRIEGTSMTGRSWRIPEKYIITWISYNYVAKEELTDTLLRKIIAKSDYSRVVGTIHKIFEGNKPTEHWFKEESNWLNDVYLIELPSIQF